jgi:hypothetical protein
MMLLGGGGLRANNMSASLLNISAATGIRSATVTFNSDGTCGASGGSSSVSGNWFSPTTTGIGTSFWMKRTSISGAGYNNGGDLGDGLIHQCTAGLTFSISNTGTNVEAVGNAGITFYTDAGGVNAVGSCAISFDVGFAP